MGSKRKGSRPERRVQDENEESQAKAVQIGDEHDKKSPSRKPLRTTSSASQSLSSSPSTRTTRTAASRIRSSRLALEELEEEGEDASQPVQQPLRRLSEHSTAQGSYRSEKNKKSKSKRKSSTTKSKEAVSSTSHVDHDLYKPPPLTFGKWAAPEHRIQQPPQNLHLAYATTNDNTEPLPEEGLYPNTDGLSSRSSLTGDFSLKQFDSMRSSDADSHSQATVDLVLDKRYSSRNVGSSNKKMVATRLTPPTLATIQSQEVMPGGPLPPRQLGTMQKGEVAATGVLIDDDSDGDDSEEDIYKTKRRQHSEGIAPTPLRPSTSATASAGINKRDMRISTISAPNRRGHHDPRGRSDSLSTMSTMPDPPSLRQGGHYTQPGAYRMSSGEEPRMPDADSVGGSLRTQTTTITRPPVLHASLVRDEETASLRSTPPGPVDLDELDDECPSPPPPANYTVSLGELTHMTAATTASPIVEAHPLDDAHTFREFFSNRKVKATICLLSGLFVILTLGTIYGVTGFVFDNQETRPPLETDSPTAVPTRPGDPELEFFVDSALPEYTRKALKKQNSPQSKALAWLRNNTHLIDYSLPQRLQRFALATFYYATGGDRRWEHSAGWLSDENECNWYSRANGTFCENGDYVKLSLPRNDLRGTLPNEMALLTSLEVLNLDENVMTGFLTTTIGEMSNLRQIHLFDNYLSGTIPYELGDATALEVLNLQFNFLAQLLPEMLGQLGNLKELLLDRNVFVGSLPSEYGQLSMIETFYLHFNDLDGTLPTELGSLSNIRDLRLDINGFSGTIPTEIGLWRHAVDVTFGNNTLTGTIPTEIGMCQQLTYLDFFLNELTGPLPSEIGLLTKSKRLYFEMNQLTGNIPTEIGTLEDAELFWAHQNELEGEVPTEIGLMTTLKYLDLSVNMLTGSMPTEIGLLTNLDILYMERNEFEGQIPSELGWLDNLTLMALHGNQFTGEMPAEVCALVETGKLSQANLTVNCDMVLCSCCTCR